MLFNLLHVLFLGALFLYTLHGAKRALTRRLSLVPLVMCGMEMIVVPVLEIAAFPVLSVLLGAARLTVLACCVLAVRRDAAWARAKSATRARRARARLRIVRSSREAGCAA